MYKPRVSINDDYAVLSTKNASFYYGYEVTINEMWCFEAKFNDEKVTIPFSRLGVDDQWDVVECLMMGIGLILAKYKLKEEL